MNIDSINYRTFVQSLEPQLVVHRQKIAAAAIDGRESRRTRHPGQQPHGGVGEAPNSLGAPYIEPPVNPWPREGRRTFGRHTPGIYTGLTDHVASAAAPLTQHATFSQAAGLEGEKIATLRNHVQHKMPTSWAGVGAPPPPGLAGRYQPHGEIALPGENRTGRRHTAAGYGNWMSEVGSNMQDPRPSPEDSLSSAQRPRPPQLPHMRTEVDEIIFGRDQDGSLAAQPITSSAKFAGAAGMDTQQLARVTAASREPRHALWTQPPPPHLRTQVDELVFGHDIDRSSQPVPSSHATLQRDDDVRPTPRVVHPCQPPPRVADDTPAAQRVLSQVSQHDAEQQAHCSITSEVAGRPTVGRSGFVSHFASQIGRLG
eukprot:scaffold90046_cov30-Tisochrysis_lutea.AAC.2